MTIADITKFVAPRYRDPVVVVAFACTVLVGAAAFARTDVLTQVDNRISAAASSNATTVAAINARLEAIEATQAAIQLSQAETEKAVARIEGYLSASREKTLDSAAAPR